MFCYETHRTGSGTQPHGDHLRMTIKTNDLHKTLIIFNIKTRVHHQHEDTENTIILLQKSLDLFLHFPMAELIHWQNLQPKNMISTLHLHLHHHLHQLT